MSNKTSSLPSCHFVFLLKVTVFAVFFLNDEFMKRVNSFVFVVFIPLRLSIFSFSNSIVTESAGYFFCGTRVVPNGEKSSILPAWVANHAQHRNCFILPAHHIIKGLNSASSLLRFQIFIALSVNV